MTKATLLFPDTTTLAEFVLTERIKGAEVWAQSLTANFTALQLARARNKYGAVTAGKSEPY